MANVASGRGATWPSLINFSELANSLPTTQKSRNYCRDWRITQPGHLNSLAIGAGI